MLICQFFLAFLYFSHHFFGKFLKFSVTSEMMWRVQCKNCCNVRMEMWNGPNKASFFWMKSTRQLPHIVCILMHTEMLVVKESNMLFSSLLKVGSEEKKISLNKNKKTNDIWKCFRFFLQFLKVLRFKNPFIFKLKILLIKDL